LEHARVSRVGEDDFLAGVGEREQRIQQAVTVALVDDDLGEGVVAGPAPACDQVGHGFFRLVKSGERQVGVGGVLADRRTCCVHGGSMGRDLGVVVLEPEDVGIHSGCGGDAVDAEARDRCESLTDGELGGFHREPPPILLVGA
jgi:hypothetical protein